MKLIKGLPALLLLAAASHQSAQAGLIFNWLNSTGNAQADTAFDIAAARWSSVLNDNITVNLTRGYSALGSGILGATSSTDDFYTYSAVRSALISDATSASDATATANLASASSGVKMLINRTSDNPNGSGSATPYLDANGSANNKTINMSNANAKALGLIAANATASDGDIQFSTSFNFDFDPSDGITGGYYDFVGVATHELGHLLGFFSGVDILDYNSPPSAGPYSSNAFIYVTPLDLFRYSSDSYAQGAGTLDWTADTRSKYFSIDGGASIITTFSTGVTFGDGRQASHWKDSLGIGIMDPTAAPGELLSISAIDLQGMDVIGYNVATPEPGTWLLLGSALIFMWGRHSACTRSAA